ncbi:hypothetical protein OIV83_002961 [Microbotryomycetes sp. JL201]|nr:hypothetical protein OIV83_002961 [Microbotryomycetes sp. JL201]
MAATTPLATRLLQCALPLVPELGFTTQTLVAAAARNLEAPLDGQVTERTIHSLFPSPAATDRDGLWRRRSLKRSELIADAHGHGPRRDRTGPAKALLEHWLGEGRRQMANAVFERRQQQQHSNKTDRTPRSTADTSNALVRHGIRHRLNHNRPVLDTLTEDLALLSAPSSQDLVSLTRFLPFASPSPYLAHVARIAHDLAKASGDESQGLDWYAVRARIGTAYGAAELHLLSPSSRSLPIDERLESSYEVADKVLQRSGELGQSVEGATLFGRWVGKSWAGMGRSLGL